MRLASLWLALLLAIADALVSPRAGGVATKQLGEARSLPAGHLAVRRAHYPAATAGRLAVPPLRATEDDDDGDVASFLFPRVGDGPERVDFQQWEPWQKNALNAYLLVVCVIAAYLVGLFNFVLPAPTPELFGIDVASSIYL
mmetsp:Transcript_10715/g.34281  ORF Transcript_10715/g.34281 Transcript_10715/m.34281 type:complete len:142 (+) Transcript_10715:21-446(+)|eukprot:CAMPEP_0197387394 /NCGR_PEP_ID=MMETSP1165-20131217/495_1 /TAXON_ID=284809 /ORGANISM="Chrysocystis fragilis, Strain CCMP3189" /LENGTH=141 /DNA_ID=CAMNT_0042912713 /DNA_START=1 /DNA_END=426 /DNA_ORIENTATION=+